MERSDAEWLSLESRIVGGVGMRRVDASTARQRRCLGACRETSLVR
jgi:hypothetical protein